MTEEVVDQVLEEAEKSSLNTQIAILVSLVATFLAVVHVKADNIVQKMAELQVQMNNQWAFFQAKSMKQNLAENQVDQLTALQILVPAGNTTAANELKGRILKAQTEVARYQNEKTDISKEAKKLEEERDALGVHDDQFDICEATLSIAMSMFAMTALTRKRWLLWFAIVIASFGVVFGVAGLCGWGLRAGALASLLS